MIERQTYDFAKMRVGVKSLDDAILNIDSLKKYTPVGDKKTIIKAIENRDIDTLREASNFFYNVSGIYQRLCKYMSFLYKYDWYVIPYIDKAPKKEEKILKDFSQLLNYLDNSSIRKMCGDLCLDIIKNGCYYGYCVESADEIVLQELPVKYCRSRFNHNNEPTVEFNMKYFDDQFRDTSYRLKVLSMFPKEFSKGYVLYKEGKLPAEYVGDSNGWYLLDPEKTVKFNFNGSDVPMFISVIPAIIDLDEAQALDRKKTMQQLLKIIIQKLPIDKNGELIFDVEEAKDLHENAVHMLSKAVGVDILTTFADIDVANMADKNTTTSVDELEKVERAVFNQAGISNNLFNTTGNNALDKSICNDEATMRNVLFQFEKFVNKAIKRFNRNANQYHFKVKFLETTQYNYKDLSKMYKEHVQNGYSKMLPQIALGHTQSEILAMINFENDIMHLSDIMIPPLQSSVMSGKKVDKTEQNGTGKNNNTTEEKKNGRPALEDSEKSDKTLANEAAIG